MVCYNKHDYYYEHCTSFQLFSNTIFLKMTLFSLSGKKKGTDCCEPYNEIALITVPLIVLRVSTK
jgi:hypothetical protein